MIAGNAAISGVNYCVTQKLSQKDITVEGLAVSQILGAFAGWMGGPGILSGTSGKEIIDTQAALKLAELLGLKTGQEINSKMLKELVKKAEIVGALRTLAGAFVTNILDNAHTIISEGSAGENV